MLHCIDARVSFKKAWTAARRGAQLRLTSAIFASADAYFFLLVRTRHGRLPSAVETH